MLTLVIHTWVKEIMYGDSAAGQEKLRVAEGIVHASLLAGWPQGHLHFLTSAAGAAWRSIPTQLACRLALSVRARTEMLLCSVPP